MQHSWGYEMDNSNIETTIYPICLYDEGQGSPSAYEANPMHSSFVVADSPNCFPESRIDNIYTTVQLALTSKAIDDNIPAIKMAYMPIYTTFDDLTAIDELSSQEIQDALEMQSESSDNQAFPLFTGSANKMAERFSNSSLIGADMAGLTTSQKLEGVAFSLDAYYDNLQFMTTASKLKACQGGLKWLTLTPNKPIVTIKIKHTPKTKMMVKKSFFGVLITVPKVDTQNQIPVTADITVATQYISCLVTCRFNEWNDQFNMQRQ